MDAKEEKPTEPKKKEQKPKKEAPKKEPKKKKDEVPTMLVVCKGVHIIYLED